MAKYKKCPRCELNWIPVDEELCEVCKAELGKASSISLIDEDEDELFAERICPICKVNFLEGDEDMCPTCRAEKAEKGIVDEDESWKEFVEDEEPEVVVDDSDEVSLTALQEDEEDDEDDDEEIHDEVDDFDESFVEFDENDFEEDDEDDDEDEEE